MQRLIAEWTVELWVHYQRFCNAYQVQSPVPWSVFGLSFTEVDSYIFVWYILNHFRIELISPSKLSTIHHPFSYCIPLSHGVNMRWYDFSFVWFLIWPGPSFWVTIFSITFLSFISNHKTTSNIWTHTSSRRLFTDGKKLYYLSRDSF